MTQHPASEEIRLVTEDLIRFRTTADRPDQLRQCAAYIETYLKKSCVNYQRFDIEGIASFLVVPGNGWAPVTLMSHYDVVEGPAALFSPRTEGGLLYGRGSLDDKYAVALSLVMVKERMKSLKSAGRGQADLGVGILITGDEEIGGSRGAQPVLGMFRTGFAISLDGGGLDKVVIKEKGVLRARLIAGGVACHGSRPWLGRNAIEALMADYEAIRKLFPKSGKEDWRRTVNPAMIRGGTAPNQVPDQCELVMDIRYTEHDDPDALIRSMEKAINGTLEIEFLEPVFVSMPDKHLDLLKNVVPQIAVGSEHGASDARHLMRYQIPGVVWGADGDLSHHSSDEHVDLKSVTDLYDRIDTFVDRVGK